MVTLLTGSDMSVINSGPKRKDYSDHSSYSYSGIGPKERALKLTLLMTLFLTFVLCRTHRVLSKYSYFIFYYFISDKHQNYLPFSFLQQLYLLHTYLVKYLFKLLIFLYVLMDFIPNYN